MLGIADRAGIYLLGSIVIFWVPLNLEGAGIGRTGPKADGLHHRE